MSMKIYSFTELYEFAVNYLVANQDKITDLNENQGLDTQLRAFATMLNDAYIRCAGGFKLQFEDIPYKVFQFARKQATTASSTVIFSRTGDLTDPVTIEAGTIVSTQGGLLFTTESDVTINSASSSSAPVGVVANDSGTSYNVPVNAINIIVSNVDGVNSVTNNTSASGGTDKENNANYYSRFAKYIVGLSKCSNFGVYTIAAQTSSVQSASVEEHFPAESGIYNFTIYIDDGSGSSPQALLDEVYLRVKGDGTAEYPGGSAAGLNFKVEQAGLVPVNVVMELDIDTIRGTEDSITTQAEQIVQNYIDNAVVGQDILPARLSSLLMGITNVYNVNSLTLNGGTSTISIADNQIARTGTITVNFSGSNPR